MPNRRGVNHFQQQGFTLIEVLIAVLVLSFGLLAIGNFQATLLKESAYSKARGEAIALAQEKLEELRNFSTDHDLVGNLNNTPVATPAVNSEYKYPTDVQAALNTYTDATINGSNATFTRKWSISRNGAVTIASVKVTWTGEDNKEQTVTLETKLANSNPRGTADIGQISNPKVESPTGKAYLGDGSLDQTAMDKVKGDTKTTKNNDGTYTADYDGDGDLELIVANPDGKTGEVALTLPGACKLKDKPCLDFVKISGSVFLDRTSKLGVNANQVFVLASDAAYCARWVPTSVDTATNTLVTESNLAKYTSNASWPALGKSDGKIYRNNDAIEDNTGDMDTKSDYDYFNYTCYLGGGWYGNIGVVITGINAQAQNNIFGCAGDPEVPLDVNGDAVSVTDAWKVVEVLKRRVYRGMIQRYTTDVNGDHVLEVDGSGVDVVKTHGIKDALVLPDKSWSGHEAGHDFVLVSGNSQTQADCLTALTRPDANPPAVAPATTPPPNLFHGVVGDFVCLNADGDDTATAPPWDKFLYAPWDYLNTPFDTTVYDAPGDCPYNPSNPPSNVFQITGTLALMDGPSDVQWGSADPTDMTDAILGNINTSKAVGDCSITGHTASGITYSCKYYVWEDKSKPNVTTLEPWSGNIQVDAPRDLVCAPNNPYAEANLDRHAVYPRTGLKGTPNPETGVDFTCYHLNKPTIEGILSVDAGNDLTGMSPALPVAVDSVDSGCTWTVQSPLEYHYSCTVLEQSYKSGYTGDVSITLPAGLENCTASTGSSSGTAAVSADTTDPTVSVATFSFSALMAGTIDNNVVCDGPNQQYIISGTAKNIANPLPTTALSVVASITGDFPGNCTNTSPVDYTCKVVVSPRGSTFTGNVTLAPNADYWCDVTGSNSTLAVSTAADTTLPLVECDSSAAQVIIRGAIYTPLSYVKPMFGTLSPDGIGDYDSSCNYLGPNLGMFDCFTDFVRLRNDPAIPSPSMIATNAGMPNGKCSFTTTPSAAEPLEKELWHPFSCNTDTKINRNKRWEGAITFELLNDPNPLMPATKWEFCQLGGYNNAVTITGQKAVITYPNSDKTSGLLGGSIVDDTFLALTYSGVGCGPYASPLKDGPWNWTDSTGTYSLTATIPPTLTPSYVHK